jgi:hypothetical protein
MTNVDTPTLPLHFLDRHADSFYDYCYNLIDNKYPQLKQQGYSVASLTRMTYYFAYYGARYPEVPQQMINTVMNDIQQMTHKNITQLADIVEPKENNELLDDIDESLVNDIESSSSDKDDPLQNVSSPVNRTPPQNVSSPVNRTSPQNVSSPVNRTPPQNVSSPVNRTPPQNVSSPVNRTPPQRVKSPRKTSQDK